MKISKAKAEYDLYRAELSYMELNALMGALDSCGKGAVSDELAAGFKWYLEKLPKPGEDDDAEGEDDEGGLPDPEAGKEPLELGKPKTMTFGELDMADGKGDEETVDFDLPASGKGKAGKADTDTGMIPDGELEAALAADDDEGDEELPAP